jgi:hypothetical protein
MTQAKYGVIAMLAVILAALTTTSVSMAQTQPMSHDWNSPLNCYWRIHPRSHETGNLPAALAEAQHSLWLAIRPQCGSAPLIQSAGRWSRLLVSPLQ